MCLRIKRKTSSQFNDHVTRRGTKKTSHWPITSDGHHGAAVAMRGKMLAATLLELLTSDWSKKKADLIGNRRDWGEKS